MPKSPSSTHITLHISIARAWAEVGVEERRVIAKYVGDGEFENAAMVKFVQSVRAEACARGRGNIFQTMMDREVSDHLPSFMNALREALVLEGGDGKDVALYELDFAKNNMEWKAKYEIAVKGLRMKKS
jgi:hypothetical protein